MTASKRWRALRRRMPEGLELPDYRLTEGPPDPGEAEPAPPPDLLDLFGEHRTLVVYHLMFHPDADAACSMCSMWVDEFHGVSHHLAQHTAFAVVGKAPFRNSATGHSAAAGTACACCPATARRSTRTSTPNAPTVINGR
ncbi:DUF899 family protein [Saccharopolyspora sp. CA-218241]|uniref:DUF899 family protein n=1 Tax=Saccharopolyspora sp. CA-218241 TaxID=3240027 RepID=UPI003D966417